MSVNPIRIDLGQITGYDKAFAADVSDPFATTGAKSRAAEKAAWAKFDDNGSGAITKDEFVSTLREDYGSTASDSILNQTWEDADANMDGSIDRQEFDDSL